MLKLVSNKIRCKFCGDVIESFSVHDFKRCRCGKCSTDGGLEYAQRSFITENPEDTYEDLSIYRDDDGKLVNASDADKKDIPIKPIRVEIKEVDEPEVVAELDDSLAKTTYSPDIPEVIEEQSDEPENPIVNPPKWGKSKYATKDGKLTEEGKKRYFETEK